VRAITVLAYDPQWAESFAREAHSLAALLGEGVIDIQHVGSTAVVGMYAKPIVDVLVVVGDLQPVDELEVEFTRRGYLVRGENGIPGRRYLVKGTHTERSHHIHIYAAGHPDRERMLAVRDYLRQNPAEAAAYSALKLELAAQFPADSAGYSAGKAAFVQSLLARALAWQHEQPTTAAD